MCLMHRTHVQSLTLANLLVTWMAWCVTADEHPPAAAAANWFAGWNAQSPREEIEPDFVYDPRGGRDGSPGWVIECDQREGLHGYWSKAYSVTGGKHYRFQVFRKSEGVGAPRRSALVRINWSDEQGRRVLLADDQVVADYLRGGKAWAMPEHPRDEGLTKDGWMRVAGTYQAPVDATRAEVELHLMWAPGGRIVWSNPSLEEVEAPPPRVARLAAVHLRPRGGKSAKENCRMFAPLIEQAAKQKADLVVLPETLTYCGTGLTREEVAEPVPGPSTEYFGKLARDHDLYLVAGLYERAGHLIYNVAVLIGPDGQVHGKYRKVTLPTGEGDRGVAPGEDYPVFQTRFGKVGMMVCYDGFFPEVARRLTCNGAEVIAWPVWGCNPKLAVARAVENHVYVVSSTYEDISRNWMVTAVFDHTGKTIALAKEWGTVVVAEVDLNQPTRWRSLAEFRAKIPRHRPLEPSHRD